MKENSIFFVVIYYYHYIDAARINLLTRFTSKQNGRKYYAGKQN